MPESVLRDMNKDDIAELVKLAQELVAKQSSTYQGEGFINGGAAFHGLASIYAALAAVRLRAELAEGDRDWNED